MGVIVIIGIIVLLYALLSMDYRYGDQSIRQDYEEWKRNK